MRHQGFPGARGPFLLCAVVVALTIHPPGLARAGVLPRCAVEDRWVAVRSEHFTLIADLEPREAQRYARELEVLAEALYARGRGLRDSSGVPLTIYAFADKACFAPFRQVRDGRQMDAAGIFAARELGNVVLFRAGAWSEELHTIYHEYVHSLTWAQIERLPGCINEGFADYFSTFEHGDQQAEIGRPIPGYVAWLEANDPIPLAELFAMDVSAVWQDRARRTLFYAESWALVHYLMRSAEDLGRFDQFLQAMKLGRDPARALGEAYPAESWDHLHEQLAAYISSGRYRRAWEYRFSRPFAAVPVTVRVLEPAEVRDRLLALAWDADSSRGPEIRRELAAAIGTDSTRGSAMALLGRLEESVGRPDAAEACFRRALIDGGADAAVPRAVGLTRLLRAKALEPDDAQREGMRAARPALARAVELDPENTLALAELGRTYVGEDTIPEPVLEGVERARRACPARGDVASVEHHLRKQADILRLNQAHELITGSRFVEAESLLRMVAETGEDAVVRDRARRDREQLARIWRVNDAVDDYNQGAEAWNQGRLAEAERWFESARERAPADEIGRQAAKRLEELQAKRKRRR